MVLLQEKGLSYSASAIGGIIRKPKVRGVLEEPVSNQILARKKRPCVTNVLDEYILCLTSSKIYVIVRINPLLGGLPE